MAITRLSRGVEITMTDIITTSGIKARIRKCPLIYVTNASYMLAKNITIHNTNRKNRNIRFPNINTINDGNNETAIKVIKINCGTHLH